MTAPMTTGQLAELITRHITEHCLPEPASVSLTLHTVHRQVVQVQLRINSLADTAASLLAWANTHTTLTLQAWLPPHGDRVHLNLHATLTGAHGTANLLVYGAVDAHALAALALQPGQRCPVSLGQLTAWANQSAGAAA